MVDCVYSRVPRMPIYTKPQQLLLDGPMERTNDLILERPCSGSGWCLRIVGTTLPKRELFGIFFGNLLDLGTNIWTQQNAKQTQLGEPMHRLAVLCFFLGRVEERADAFASSTGAVATFGISKLVAKSSAVKRSWVKVFSSSGSS